MYCYPEEIDDALIEAIKKEEKVCHYLDLPIQHASDRVLKRMGRKTDKATLRAVIGKLREEIPDICLRTTLITGFPGESEEEHEEVMEFINEMEFDRLGVFYLFAGRRYSGGADGGTDSGGCKKRAQG